MSISKKSFKTISIILTLITLSSCSTYPSKFRCGDARGLGCTMLSEVDRQITSGKIEEAYMTGGKNCRRGRCVTNSKDQDDSVMPILSRGYNTKVLTGKVRLDDNIKDEYSDGQYLYFRD